MKISALTLAAFVPSALSHGWVNVPPTRGEVRYGQSNERGFPIGMKSTCTSLPPRAPTTISPGPLTIRLQFNDGANHVGMCTVFIADQSGNNRKKIGELNNCARSLHPGPGNKGDAPIPAEMTVNVPASGCGQKNCMLFWTLAATHISTTNPEIYDDCMDVTISGGGSNPPPPPPPNNPPPSNPPPSNGGGNCGAAWSKCGGKGFTGPTCCTSGYKCARQDEWYSQCIPN